MMARELDLASQMLKAELLPADSDDAHLLAPLTPETLHELVSGHVQFLLENDFSRLLASLYQIDVAEELVAQAFRLPSRSETVAQITSLIIDREVTKAHVRESAATVESELRSV